MDIFKFLPFIMRIMSLAPRVTDAIRRGVPIITMIEEFGPELWSLIKDVGAKWFPELPAEQQVEIGALTTFATSEVKHIQDAMNRLGFLAGGKQIMADGDYGPKTKDVVMQFQKKHNIDPADGWAGKMTRPIIDLELSKLPA